MVWRVADKQQETSKNPDLIPADETTDETTSHLTNPAKYAG
jgi:hypothetical protein